MGVYRRIDSQKTRFTVPLTRRPETNFSDRISDDISSQINIFKYSCPLNKMLPFEPFRT